MQARRQVSGVGAGAGFDKARFATTNAGTAGSDDPKTSFDVAAKHRDPVANAFCAAVLVHDRGDDVAAMRRYLAREVPRPTLAGMLLTGAAVLLARAVLPVIHWAGAAQDR